jgi:hypothetical protein
MRLRTETVEDVRADSTQISDRTGTPEGGKDKRCMERPFSTDGEAVNPETAEHSGSNTGTLSIVSETGITKKYPSGSKSLILWLWAYRGFSEKLHTGS